MDLDPDSLPGKVGPVRVDCEEEYDVEEVPIPDVPELLYAVYSDLKARGYWVCDGASSGADFAVYETAPGSDHSFALVWCESGDFDTRKLIQYMRIAESALKSAVLAIAGAEGIRYICVTRVKPAQDPQSEQR
jgi:tRNA splicing endonuclease